MQPAVDMSNREEAPVDALKFHHLFCYGTLKRQYPNHRVFQDGGKATFLHEASTVEKYPLVFSPITNSPFLVNEPGTGQNISGELYEVDEAMLATLDILERNGSIYVREEILVRLHSELENGEVQLMKAWAYLLPDWHPDLLRQPFLAEYSSTTVAQHRRPYIFAFDQGVGLAPLVKNSHFCPMERLVFLYDFKNGEPSRALLTMFGGAALTALCLCRGVTVGPVLLSQQRVEGKIYRMEERLFLQLLHHQENSQNSPFEPVEVGESDNPELEILHGSVMFCWLLRLDSQN